MGYGSDADTNYRKVKNLCGTSWVSMFTSSSTAVNTLAKGVRYPLWSIIVCRAEWRDAFTTSWSAVHFELCCERCVRSPFEPERGSERGGGGVGVETSHLS